MATNKDLPDNLRDNYHTWHETVFERQRGLFEDLVTNGQHPETMVISCCDSRIDITSIFGSNPGDLFIHRNIASLIPPYEDRRTFPGTVAAIEYGVTALGVRNLVIMGHSQCGGVKGCYDICTGHSGALDPEVSSVGQWVDMLRPSMSNVISSQPEDIMAALEQDAVRFSVANVLAYPFVQDAVVAGALQVRGLWHELKSGDIFELNMQSLNTELF